MKEGIIKGADGKCRCWWPGTDEEYLHPYFLQFQPAQRKGKLDYATAMTFTTTDESKALSKDLKKRGWSFVGPTTCHASMQAMGLVNDHLEGCFKA